MSTSFKNQLRRITAGCVIVFEMLHRNGDCTFYVAVKIGGDSKKMLGLGAISFDKAFWEWRSYFRVKGSDKVIIKLWVAKS
jgi:hypothetical protein